MHKIFIFLFLNFYINSTLIAEVLTFTGNCDASAAATIDSNNFVVGDDELNILQIYNVQQPGPAVYEYDLNEYFNQQLGKAKEVKKKKKKKSDKPKKFPEIDIEGGARVGNTIYWIASHGLKKDGSLEPSRFVLFATDINTSGSISLIPKGKPYTNLLSDLMEDPQYLEFNLKAASEKAPNLPGGLNIEGLTNNAQGELLIGFRSPVFSGKALIARLKNPLDVINGNKAVFSAPELLDTASAGIRGMASWRGKYFYVTSATANKGPAVYYSNLPGLKEIPINAAENLNPETLVVLPDSRGGSILIVSDDGERISRNGLRCKDLKERSQKNFRVLQIRPDNLLLPLCPNNSFEC